MTAPCLQALVKEEPGVEVAAFDGLVVDHARRAGARVLLRSIRGPRDYEYELQMAFANRSMVPELETVFLAPSAATGLISSTLVREVAAMGGDVSAWVPPAVAEALAAKHPRR
ncbi:MAG: pantetheine-phosphate adenylyltransferase [Planctomycetota bacterium]